MCCDTIEVRLLSLGNAWPSLRTMNQMSFRIVVCATALFAAAVAATACGDQSEGQPCGVVTAGATDFSQYNDQCGSGLVCAKKSVGGNVRGVCCPASGTSTEEVCGSTTSTVLEAGPLDATSGGDAAEDVGTADSGLNDTGTPDTGAADTGTRDAAADSSATDGGTPDAQ
jgi:hypothetical protein